MSATMSKTHMSPDFLTKFLEEYREMPVLWQVHKGEQTLDLVSEPTLLKRKKTFSKTSRSVHGEEQQRQNLIKQAMSVLS